MTPSLKEFLCRSVAALAFLTGGAAFAQTTLLNVSYDVSRNGMVAPSRNGIRVPKWRCDISTTKQERRPR